MFCSELSPQSCNFLAWAEQNPLQRLLVNLYSHQCMLCFIVVQRPTKPTWQGIESFYGVGQIARERDQRYKVKNERNRGVAGVGVKLEMSDHKPSAGTV